MGSMMDYEANKPNLEKCKAFSSVAGKAYALSSKQPR